MTMTRRLLVAVLTLLLTGTVLSAVAAPAEAARARVSLNSVGARYVGSSIPIVGYLHNAGSRHNKTLYLQRYNHGWRYVARLTHRTNGRFAFHSQRVSTPQRVHWRVVAKRYSRTLGAGYLTVNVKRRPVTTPPPAPTCANAPSPTTCPKPAPRHQHRDVVLDPECKPEGGGTVTTEHQDRDQAYVWSPEDKEWQLGDPPEWSVTSKDVRAATEAECPAPPPVTQVLPDLAPQKLTRCSQAERDETPNNTCFHVETSTLPNGTTARLLKFPASTFNIGAGAVEINSTRDNAADGKASWHDTLTTQRIYHSDGTYEDRDITSGIDFYWQALAVIGNDNHGHKHWHIYDFDSYTLDGNPDIQEKHGFCLSSTADNGPSLSGAGELDPRYDDSQACGFGNENATSITHGLSPRYGDTYPSHLPDQGIDIGDLTSGVHTIQVCVDQHNVLTESNEDNNCAKVDVEINGDLVSPVGGTETGL
jgi:hypothetical protein